MSPSGAPLQRAAELAPEEQVRANFYALLARLFYAPPDQNLLAALAAADEIVAEGEDSPLALAWRRLTLAAAGLEDAAVRHEYDSVFVGTGKAPVSPYAGAYLRQTAMENPLVVLRNFLAAHGLARHESVHEPEDHVAALSDVMRHLIAEQHRDFDLQREFFMRFLWPAAPGFCAAAIAAERTDFYRAVARFAECFFALEHAAFDMQ